MIDRRRFIEAAGIAAVGGMISAQTSSAAPDAPPKETAPALPTVTVAGKKVTRLIAGSNPIHGYSVPTQAIARHMSEYFTVERTAEFLIHCESVGINTFQGSYSEKIRDALRLAWDRGSKIQWLCLAADTPEKSQFDAIFALHPFAVVHHGGVTDTLFRSGKSEAVNDFIKKVHDKGIPAGVSSHVPAHIRAVEEKGWDNDFTMNCFYNVVRTEAELKRDLGGIPLDKLFFLATDPDVMTDVIRKSKKPCLGYKILGAGRQCWSPDMVEKAFAYAFRSIKPTDAVIVGMYPVFEDEPKMNAALTRKYGAGGVG